MSSFKDMYALDTLARYESDPETPEEGQIWFSRRTGTYKSFTNQRPYRDYLNVDLGGDCFVGLTNLETYIPMRSLEAYDYMSGIEGTIDAETSVKQISYIKDDGPVSGCLDFSTPSSVIDTNQTYDYLHKEALFTISFSFKLSDLAADAALFGNTMSGSESGVCIKVSTSGQLTYSAFPTGVRVTASTTILVDTWYHLVISCNVAADITIYLNGLVDNSQAYGAVSAVDSPRTAYIGGCNDASPQFSRARIANLRVQSSYCSSSDAFLMSDEAAYLQARASLGVNLMRSNVFKEATESQVGWNISSLSSANDGVTSGSPISIRYGSTYTSGVVQNNGRGLAVEFTYPVALKAFNLYGYFDVMDAKIEYYNGSIWVYVTTALLDSDGKDLPTGGAVITFNHDGAISSTKWRWVGVNYENYSGVNNFYAYEVEAYDDLSPASPSIGEFPIAPSTYEDSKIFDCSFNKFIGMTVTDSVANYKGITTSESGYKAPSETGYSASLTSTGSFINFKGALNDKLSGPDVKFSICVTFKATFSNANGSIVSKYGYLGAHGSDTPQFRIYLNSGYIAFRVYFGVIDYRDFFVDTPSITADTWFRLCVTYDGAIDSGDGADRVTLSVDGEIQSYTFTTTGALSDIPTASSNLCVAGDIGATDNVIADKVACQVANLQIYDKVLSQAEILQISKET